MGRTFELLRSEPRGRVFFVALTQSTLGTGAAYVGLLLIAYDRLESPWAISLVLLADLVPAMLLGPIFGAAADRWSRRSCTVVADVIRAAAFVGIAFVDSFAATIALAFLAGAGTGLFTPAALSALPGLVDPRRLPAATSLYGAITDLGFTAGPAAAAGVLLFGTPETLMMANGVSFAASALLLVRLPFGARPLAPEDEGHLGLTRPSLLAEARDGIRATAGMHGMRVLLLASAAALFFGGVFNVGELLFAKGELGATGSAYSVLVALFGFGFIIGSLAGSAGGQPPHLKRRYLAGVFIMGAGFLTSGLAPALAIALATFALAGIGNGMLLVYERLLVQTTVDDAVMGRIFGVKDALTAWAFGIAFLSAGALIDLLGTRGLLVLSGVGAFVICAVAAVALRHAFVPSVGTPMPDVENAPDLRRRAHAVRDGSGSQHGTNLVDRREHWLALLDDLREGDDDSGVELGPRVSE
jgi:MFS family permease